MLSMQASTGELDHRDREIDLSDHLLEVIGIGRRFLVDSLEECLETHSVFLVSIWSCKGIFGLGCYKIAWRPRTLLMHVHL